MTSFDIKEAYLKFLKDDPDMTMPIAAIESLVLMLRQQRPTTLLELITLVRKNIDVLKSSFSNAVSLSAGCDLFMRFVLRNTNVNMDWESCMKNLSENGQLFVQRAKESREKLAEYGLPFIEDDDTILVHSYSRVVYHLLWKAKTERLVRFKVVVTESRPTEKGLLMALLLREAGIPVEVIVDNAVGYVMHNVDKVLVGAEGVVESGGIINHIGSYQIGSLAKSNNKPFYVVTESHKFVRLFPLSPNDLPNKIQELVTSANLDNSLTNDKSSLSRQLIDYTPGEYITALITDLGVLTPAAVSEELIKVWYD
ncbi:translation initiation factor eIF-2B subunit alpha [Scheffersomyces spartinae]|uniref:Translation initiation factor eIF2B subunit alpha n=1 Tax=Scheffersomyces spartinae TaxID=45513 RepID=A0A9P7V757_9ASCO|nr:translation initiation factor eIF-2B subunit alpha [Scheffersomyces spartinae]KAG7192624.1 translation initiation factor eIF-2B subunit alpha [Scheffersomyces spartinae]